MNECRVVGCRLKGLALQVLAVEEPPGLVETPTPFFPLVLVARRALEVAADLLETGSKAVNQLLLFVVES